MRDRHVVTININHKRYMESSNAPLDLTFSDLKSQIQGHPHCEALYLVA